MKLFSSLIRLPHVPPREECNTERSGGRSRTGENGGGRREGREGRWEERGGEVRGGR